MLAVLTALARNRFYRVRNWKADSSDPDSGGKPIGVTDVAEANLISSQLAGSDLHSVVIDIDVPATLVPSTTFGHSHLYIDAKIEWKTYVSLLEALAEAGVVEPGYVTASKARGFTAVRLPWISKQVVQ